MHPNQSYEGMLANLERIRNRLAGQSCRTVAILKILWLSFGNSSE